MTRVMEFEVGRPQAGRQISSAGQTNSIPAADAGGRLDRSWSQEKRTVLTTTDGITTTLVTVTLDDDAIYVFDLYVIARRTDSSKQAVFHRKVAVFREAGGSATIIGTILTPLTRPVSTNYTATFDVTGNDLRVRVTGQAAETVNWESYMDENRKAT